MLKSLKLTALRAARGSGALRLINSSDWRHRRLLILGYHGVSQADEHEWDSSLFMPQEMVRSRFELLRHGGYAVLPLAEAIQRLRDGSLPDRSVAITFDDGSADFFSRAHPLIQEFGFPVTLYLTTFYSRDQRPVFPPMCSYLLWWGRTRRISGQDLVPNGGPLDLTNPAKRRSAFEAIVGWAAERQLDAAHKDDLLGTLAERVGVDYQALRQRRLLQIMSAEEIAQLDPRAVDVQLHTHRHRVLLNRELFRREIEDNRREIARLTGSSRALTHFCYPSGVTHPQFLPWLRELGIESATTCYPGIASADTDPLMLPRLVDTCSLTTLEFESWLTGGAALLPSRRLRVEHQD
jgi:peptidoglycan/xylan/chitin deacetylase (PgdA/CDA1 family)